MEISFSKSYQYIEKSIGSLKFAVVIILLFTIFMIAGTFVESLCGPEFANKVIYKSWYFMCIQGGMFLSILFATLIRLPMKKNLYGFYVIHSGLLTIGAGSLITYLSGLDGQLYLAQNIPTSRVFLSQNLLRLNNDDERKSYVYTLPNSIGAKNNIDESIGPITVLTYLPTAKLSTSWQENSDQIDYHSAKYLFKNRFAKETLYFSTHPDALDDFSPEINMGPLAFHYFPPTLSRCVELLGKSKVVLISLNTKQCLTLEETPAKIQTTATQKKFFSIKLDQEITTFFFELSPIPLDHNLKENPNSPWRVLNFNIYENSPHLFLMGKAAGFYDRNLSRWVVLPFLIQNQNKINLPWMGAEIYLQEYYTNKIPVTTPVFEWPKSKNGQLVNGENQAVEIEIQSKKYWLTSKREQPYQFLIDGKKYSMALGKEQYQLPFTITLTKFKMDLDPGTNNPASYESFVDKFNNGEISSHHVYMNHPLKSDPFTFYQASYSKDENGNYSSTFAVNVDPGRKFKYFGSLLLIAGAIWHYTIKQRKQVS